MNSKDKLISVAYGLTALIALPATWVNNIAFMTQPDHASIADFFHAAYANAAVASLSNDLILFAFAACIFMAIEGKRMGIRYVWMYIVLSAVVAVSVMFPLFLLARHVKLAEESSLSSASEAV